jgi:hypothetical protein
MISSLEQARRRRRLNQQIRELIAIRRAIGRSVSNDTTGTAEQAQQPAPSAAA